jgi:hypothetical protein
MYKNIPFKLNHFFLLGVKFIFTWCYKRKKMGKGFKGVKIVDCVRCPTAAENAAFAARLEEEKQAIEAAKWAEKNDEERKRQIGVLLRAAFYNLEMGSWEKEKHIPEDMKISFALKLVNDPVWKIPDEVDAFLKKDFPTSDSEPPKSKQDAIGSQRKAPMAPKPVEGVKCEEKCCAPDSPPMPASVSAAAAVPDTPQPTPSQSLKSSTKICTYGRRCKRGANCWFQHVDEYCGYGKTCMRFGCSKLHPDGKRCGDGFGCKKPGCMHIHDSHMTCAYAPEECPFKEECIKPHLSSCGLFVSAYVCVIPSCACVKFHHPSNTLAINICIVPNCSLCAESLKIGMLVEHTYITHGHPTKDLVRTPIRK